jgi:homoserine kinase type II
MLHDSLLPVLARYPRQAQPLHFAEALGAFGGHSGALLWRYESSMGPIAARAWPVNVQSPEHVLTIHQWLAEAGDLGFLPVPIAALDGQTVQRCHGRLWELAPWLEGQPERKCPPDAQRVQAAFQALARLHRRLAGHATVGRSPGLANCILELEELAARGYQALESALHRAPGSELRVAGFRWLALARATAPRLLPELHDAARLAVPLQPCLRDARPDHFLFLGNEVSGLVDFGAMGVESVAADLARLAGEWISDNQSLRALAFAAYEVIRPLDPSESALMAAFEAAADLLIAGHWLRWHFLEHRRFDDPMAVPQGVARGLGRLKRRAYATGLAHGHQGGCLGGDQAGGKKNNNGSTVNPPT